MSGSSNRIKERQYSAKQWFAKIGEDISKELENIEKSQGSKARFERKSWRRKQYKDKGFDSNLLLEDFGFADKDIDRESAKKDYGGGEMLTLKNGKIFEKIGINISTIFGEIDESVAHKIPGTSNDNSFWASGVSIVVHPRSPMVPIIHMNTRFICTQKAWFGGMVDLTPCVPNDQVEADFNVGFKQACDSHNPDYYNIFTDYCDKYLYMTHRNEQRGVGGVFFDNVATNNWENDFEFVKDIGKTFKNIYPEIVRKTMNLEYNEEHLKMQEEKRTKYVEFCLLYDRGIRFGLETNGNLDTIFMHMPPSAKWE